VIRDESRIGPEARLGRANSSEGLPWFRHHVERSVTRRLADRGFGEVLKRSFCVTTSPHGLGQQGLFVDVQLGTSCDHPTYLELRGLRLDAREHPCRASRFPRRNVGSGRHLYDEIEGILATGTPKSFREFGELLGSGEIDREQPVPSDRDCRPS
jgi:hypothetical protein